MRDASEFFMQQFDRCSSSPGPEPAAETDVIVDREIIRKKKRKVIKQEASEGETLSEAVTNSIPVDETTTVLAGETVIIPSAENMNLAAEEISVDDLLDSEEDGENSESAGDAAPSDDDEDIECVVDLVKALSVERIGRVQKKIMDSFQSKNALINNLKSENDRLRTEFSSSLAVKKEKLREDLEQNKNESQKTITNVNEERDYLIEENTLKDSENKKQKDEITKLGERIQNLTSKLGKSEKLVGELQKSLKEKERALERKVETIKRQQNRFETLNKKRPPKSEVETRLILVENELSSTQEMKDKLSDQVEKLESEKYNLENKLSEQTTEVKKREERNKFLDQDLKEQRAYFEKEDKEKSETIKKLQTQTQRSEEQLKSKSLKLNELEERLSSKESSLDEETTKKDKIAVKVRQLEESVKVAEEYKTELEKKYRERIGDLENQSNGKAKELEEIFSRFKDLDSVVELKNNKIKSLQEETESIIEEKNNKIKLLEEENESIIAEDMKFIEKEREEGSQLKVQLSTLVIDKEKLEESLENMKTNLAEKEQEQITLHIKSSEKDEIINKKTHSIEKIKKKNEKLMQKLIDIAEMKDGLDNRLTMTEIKYLNLEKEVKSKEDQLAKITESLTNKEEELEEKSKQIEDIIKEKRETVEDCEEEKKEIIEQFENEKDDLLQKVEALQKERGAAEEKWKAEKTHIAKQIDLLKKSGIKLPVTVASPAPARSETIVL